MGWWWYTKYNQFKETNLIRIGWKTNPISMVYPSTCLWYFVWPPPPPPKPMVYRTLYPWYIEPPAYGILFDPPPPKPMVYRTPYPWFFEPPAYGILPDPPNPWYIETLPMVCQTTCLWYFVTKSYKDDPFAKTKTALKVQIVESLASGLFYVTTVIVAY